VKHRAASHTETDTTACRRGDQGVVGSKSVGIARPSGRDIDDLTLAQLDGTLTGGDDLRSTHPRPTRDDEREDRSGRWQGRRAFRRSDRALNITTIATVTGGNALDITGASPRGGQTASAHTSAEGSAEGSSAIGVSLRSPSPTTEVRPSLPDLDARRRVAQRAAAWTPRRALSRRRQARHRTSPAAATPGTA